MAGLCSSYSACDHAVKLLCDVQDATQLALKIVTNYALSDAGITTYASPGQSLGYMRKSFEVSKLVFGCCCCDNNSVTCIIVLRQAVQASRHLVASVITGCCCCNNNNPIFASLS